MPRAYVTALLPAISAATAGIAVHLTGGAALWSLAAAATGAAAVGLLTMRDESIGTATAQPAQPRQPNDAALAAALDALPFGVMIVRADRSIALANLEMREVFGLRDGHDMAVSTLRSRRLLDLIETAFRDEAAGTLEFSMSRRTDVHLRAHVRPLGSGEVLVAIADETQAHLTGEMHRDFVANASHELKTPLAAISGVIETLLGHAREDPAATERFLGLLDRQAKRMTRLIEDLLSLNRIELNERVAPSEPQDVLTILAEVVDTLRPIAEAADVRLAPPGPGARPVILGDRDELGQVFRNLIENAVRYGGSGTTVSIGAEIEPGEGARPGRVGISVSDEGPGIAREHIPRLTERFYRVNAHRSREKGGTGLGLAIVKHVMNRHRGRLEIASKPGAGSTFTVWFPLVRAESEGHRGDVGSGMPGNSQDSPGAAKMRENTAP